MVVTGDFDHVYLLHAAEHYYCTPAQRLPFSFSDSEEAQGGKGHCVPPRCWQLWDVPVARPQCTGHQHMTVSAES